MREIIIISSDYPMNCDVSHASHKLSRYHSKGCDFYHTYKGIKLVFILLTQFILIYGNMMYFLHEKPERITAMKQRKMMWRNAD